VVSGERSRYSPRPLEAVQQFIFWYPKRKRIQQETGSDFIMGIFESDKKRKFVFHALQEVVETGIEEVENALK
jgi:hypothetical protein